MQINYYCFNVNCKKSIFNMETCVVTKLPFDKAIDFSPKCSFCKEELVAKPLLKINRQLSEILKKKKTYKSIIIDDDLNFQVLARQLFKDSACLNESIHLSNANEALDYLTQYKVDVDLIPDFIFADINMSSIGIWDFLDHYERLAPQLGKKITIFLISDTILPVSNKRLQLYPDIKGLITKDFDIDFLNSIC